MVNLKKYNGVLKLFVIFLTLFLIVSCAKQNYQVKKIEGKLIPISENGNQVSGPIAETEQSKQIENYIKPYRDHIDNDLNAILAYCPETLDKSAGKWQTTIGNLMADVTLKNGNAIFWAREKKNIDMCMLNNGGIRATLPKGNVTAKTAYEIMPFENGLVVIALKGEQIFELVDYFIVAKKPHPLSGITFTIDKNDVAKNILIQGKAVENEQIYYVATNDYLANGGDNMNFFKKGVQRFDLDYKLRNILIDYFKKVDTIPVIKDVRISEE